MASVRGLVEVADLVVALGAASGISKPEVSLVCAGLRPPDRSAAVPLESYPTHPPQGDDHGRVRP